MLHILLVILKIIGIIILSLISLIILMLLCLLFVPVRYSANVSYHDKLKIDGKVTYLLRIIYLRYSKDNNSKITLRIFGIKTHFLDKERKIKNKKQRKKYDEETEMFEKMSEEINNTRDLDSESEEANKSYDELAILEANRDEQITDIADDSIKTEEFNDSEETKTEDSDEDLWFFSKYLRKLRNKICKIKYRFKSICGTIRKTFKKAKDFISFIKDEKTKEAFSFVKSILFKLLKHIKPRKIKGYIHFGFEDPQYTGKLLGLISIFYGSKRKDFQINPDFENKIIEGDLYLKGRIQMYVILIAAFRLYRNKNLKKVMEGRRTYGRK